MKNSQSYLTFRLHQLTYGLEISLVKEIFPLPELTIVPETPGDIIGILYLRDRHIPVMHLERRLGQPIKNCQISDCVILVEWQGIEMGIIVNEVLDVVDISSGDLQAEPDYGRENPLNSAFVAYVAQLENQGIILLNTEALIREPENVELLTQKLEKQESAPFTSNFFDAYCPDATTSERSIFRKRAKEFKTTLENEATEAAMPVAIFSLGEENFACDLDIVREFIDIEQTASIPLSANYIVGNINLRGEVVPLVDIRSVLNFSQASALGSQAIIVQIDDLRVGIVVNEVFDVATLNQAELNTTPMKVAAEFKDYFYGVATYNDSLLSAINLPQVFAQGNLIAA